MILSLENIETQVNENLASDAQQILDVDNIISGDLLQKSSLEYNVLTNPTLSIEIVQDAEQNIVIFPNQSSSGLLESGKAELLD